MRASLSYALVVLTACSTIIPISAGAHEAARQDVEAYAIASCLTYQSQPYLKDQGDGWASVIVQRSKGNFQVFTAVAAAVKKEMSKGNMAVIRNETGPARDKALPIEYCFEIPNSPAVHAAIKQAVKKLEKSYK